MKCTHSLTATALAILVSSGTLRSQEQSPQIPVGSLSAYPTIVQTGTHPTLTWSVTVPEAVDDIVDIEGPGTLVPKRDVIMDVRILGAGVTASTYYSPGFIFVPTECQINVNGSGYSPIFYGSNNDVNPNEIVYTRTVEEGEEVNFGSRYYYNYSWGPWFSTTNSNGNVVALRNGDTPPTTTPMHYAPTIETFIRPYLDEDGKIKIGPRDVLYLMELTHTNPNHSGFDLQDMALLVTFYDQVAEESTDGSESSDSGDDGSSESEASSDNDGDSSAENRRKKRKRGRRRR